MAACSAATACSRSFSVGRKPGSVVLSSSSAGYTNRASMGALPRWMPCLSKSRWRVERPPLEQASNTAPGLGSARSSARLEHLKHALVTLRWSRHG